VELERVPDLLRRLQGHPPVPWAEGVHNVWLLIRAQRVTGRRLGASRSSGLF
jgi:hypothetical protein